MHSSWTLLCVLLLLGSSEINADHWGYSGAEDPEHWAENYATCNGTRQSPININTSSVVYSSSLTDFTLTNFDGNDSSVQWKLINNGHTVVVNVISGKMNVTGGGLDGPYQVAQFHFHWGSNSSRGSEHEVNERQYPMELHIVTFKVAYGNFTNALSYGDGLAVLGFFFEISNASHPVFDKLVSALPQVHNESEITFEVFSLKALIPTDTSKYYRYLGSLTTPGCSEIVVWTLFQETIKVSEAQIEAFRQLIVHESANETIQLEDNFRPVQPLYGRQVMVSFDLRDTTTLQPSTTTLQPSATTLQPSATTLQPSTTTLQPSATTLQPSATTLQPSATTLQPSTTTLQPSATTLQPSATTLQPSTTTLQPSATTISIHWGYSGAEDPEHWAEHYPTCGGTRQSPININTSSVVYNSSLTDFTLTNFDGSDSSLQWHLNNNGHTVVVNVISGKMNVTGGGLDGPYQVAQFHFHWGSNSSRGSEHEVNEKHYPMELHIVTFKVAYGNFTNAVSYEDGLAVLGFFLEISNVDHPVFDKLVSGLPRVHNESDVVFDVFSLKGLIPTDTSKYYRYLGSLTTPGCSEVVVWTVFQETIKVSEAQIAAFRQLIVHESANEIQLEDNFRPVQPLYGRQVMVSFDLRDTTTLQPSVTSKKPSGSSYRPAFSAVLIVFSQLLFVFLCL